MMNLRSSTMPWRAAACALAILLMAEYARPQ
jgi:hypothetical protein